jgi:hypothetical protein
LRAEHSRILGCCGSSSTGSNVCGSKNILLDCVATVVGSCGSNCCCWLLLWSCTTMYQPLVLVCGTTTTVGLASYATYLKSTSWNLKFCTRCLLTINPHIVERCILLGRTEISDSDRDTIVHRSGISILIMNRRRGKVRIFKFGTKLEAKFNSATDPIVEPPKGATLFSACGKAIDNSPYIPVL